MSNFDFQVNWNSQRRSASLRILELGPRGGETERLNLSRSKAEELYEDLGRAIQMMDAMMGTWGKPDPDPPEPEIPGSNDDEDERAMTELDARTLDDR